VSLFLTRSSLYKKVLYIIYIFVNFHFSSGRDGISAFGGFFRQQLCVSATFEVAKKA
jgi:hypothetical protein